VLGSLLTLFISPDSSTITIYGSFIVLLFISCFIGYGATKLIGLSVFFIGACTCLLYLSLWDDPRDPS
jgi:hypothetical protein